MAVFQDATIDARLGRGLRRASVPQARESRLGCAAMKIAIVGLATMGGTRVKRLLRGDHAVTKT